MIIGVMVWLLLLSRWAEHPDHAKRNVFQRMMDIIPGHVDLQGTAAACSYFYGPEYADLVPLLTECRVRITYGLFEGDKFYSFKIQSNAVARIVSQWQLTRYDNWMGVPPRVKSQPPWWDDVEKEWPRNSVYYAGPYTRIWYLPDRQLCLFRVVR